MGTLRLGNVHKAIQVVSRHFNVALSDLEVFSLWDNGERGAK
jgi:hypothetical protein